MLLNLLRYGIRQTFQSLGRNFGLVLASTGIISVSLILLGGFLLVAVNTDEMVRGLEGTIEIGVFLEDGADHSAVEEQLAALDGVESFVFVSREQGLEELSRGLGEDILSEMSGEHNPLPDAFRVRAVQAEIVPDLATEIAAISGVEKTEYGGEFVHWLVSLGGWVNTASLAAGSALAAAAVFLIVTTIRLSLMARQDEVAIMTYLGASGWFVRFPYLLEGIIIGWAGSLVSVAVLATGYHNLSMYLQEMDLVFFWRPVTDLEVLLPIVVGLLVLGTLIGGLGSLVSMRRTLRA